MDSAEIVTGTKMVQTYKIAVLGDGGVGKSGIIDTCTLHSTNIHVLIECSTLQLQIILFF